ncbi:uncharacterized protein LOC120073603 [Benincasa hispida]|uniref:uncharacterized protein LOC120073603 n=1 Tax=Benincasa hispida TaxID=102211 RepID=UPI0018FF5051|nr:uncharacterized protein LOC120073603 [Benincasa hispida]
MPRQHGRPSKQTGGRNTEPTNRGPEVGENPPGGKKKVNDSVGQETMSEGESSTPQARSAYVLFDPSATHSFISSMYALIDRLVKPMPEELFISTPLGDVINFYADLLPLELLEFDAILGMDFLRNLISIVNARKLLSKGCKAYLAHVMVAQGKELNPEDVPVVNEFQDVFPEELSRLPPDREVEFIIDLVPGTTPISQAPYRMVPTELKELKV